ncbi:MAG: hypothetical protein JWP63_3640, partial [Candidatus Solibacter sp.]|nr:hypothetical protein [Candidatus Solibacter sp.]
LVVCAAGAWGQAMDPATQALIEKLQARVDSLEKRLADLEGRGAAPAAAVAAPAAAPVAAAAHEHDQTPVAPDLTHPTYPNLKIAGFGDIDFAASNLQGASGGFGAQTLLQSHSGFSEGQFILHMSSALSQKVSVFGELSFTARADAGTGTPPAPGFNPEVERLIIRYDLNDYFKISFGRYHTPINYWNTAFHHGQWLQTTISRPEMTQFGSSFLPVHFVGSLVEGQVPAGGLNLNYNVGVGNGRGQVISRPGDFGDVNNNRAWLVNGFIKPDKLYGLRVGGSVYRDLLNPVTGPVSREWIQSAHIVWDRETPEFIAEFANVSHTPVAGGVKSNSQAFYVQTAYRVQKFKPYYRFDYMHVPRSDGNFRGLVPVFHSSTVGLRYDITSFAAFKVEYRDYSRRDLSSVRGIFTQTSFTF